MSQFIFWLQGGKGVCTDTPSESAMAKGWTCQTYVDWGLNLGYYCRKAEWKEKQICGKVCGEAGEPTDPDCWENEHEEKYSYFEDPKSGHVRSINWEKS